MITAPVAQLDRVTASEAVGRGFESRRARQFPGLSRFVTPLALLLLSAAAAGDSLQSRLDATVHAFMARENVPGVAVVALRGDEVVAAAAYGWSDPAGAVAMTIDTIQPLYSVSKHITSAVVLQLAAEGRFAVDSPIAAILPETFAAQPALEVGHLLRNVSGLADFVRLPGAEAFDADPALDLAALVSFAAAPRRLFAPGERYAYSNSNYSVLALIAERRGGQPFADLQQQGLWARHGLADIGECASLRAAGRRIGRGHEPDGAVWELPPGLAAYTGSGGTCASALGLARWMRALAAGRVLDPVALAELRNERPVAAGYRPRYGGGLSTLEVAGRPAFSHSGIDQGYGAYVAHLPEDDLVLAIVANRGWLWITDLAVPLMRRLQGLPDPVLRWSRLSRADRRLLSGQFEDGLFNYSLEVEGDDVVLTVDLFPEPLRLRKQRPDHFVSPDQPDTFRLVVDRSGAAPRLLFDWLEHRSYLERRAAD